MDDKRTKVNIKKLLKMKRDQTPVAWITSYDLPFAYVAEQAGVEMILVGDSGGMVQLGYKTTNPVTMDEMITKANGKRTIPQIFFDDQHIGGYDEARALEKENKLQELLK